MHNDRDKELLTKIFSLPVQDDQMLQSWRDWKERKSNYKPFSLQFHECRENNVAFIENCNWGGHGIIMCRKYGGQCVSSKCKDERIRPEDNQCRLKFTSPTEK